MIQIAPEVQVHVCERWNIQHDTSVGQRKNPSPRQESNPWSPEHRAGALSTELWELMESKSFYWVHVWQVSCILLGSAALPNSSWVVINEWRWWILSSLIKCERWNNQHDTSVAQKKIWVPDKNKTVRQWLTVPHEWHKFTSFSNRENFLNNGALQTKKHVPWILLSKFVWLFNDRNNTT